VIKVERGTAPTDLLVYTCGAAWRTPANVTPAEREREMAKAFFTDPRNYGNDKKLTRDSFPFRIYKDPDVGAALDRVFGGKCAYCESRFAHVTPKDVEHFRPKSEIDTGDRILAPGYYWLAGDWDNLLVSCPDCNRDRRFEVPGQPKLVRLGKATQFPLKDERARARMAEPGVAAEEPLRLLIDPCKDEPEEHLTYDEQGLIHPRPDAIGAASAMGAASITVYALQRKELVEERRTTLNALRSAVLELLTAIQLRVELRRRGIDGGLLDINAESIRLIRVRVRDLLARKAPYLGMLRDWIRRQKQAGAFADLERCGVDLEAMI